MSDDERDFIPLDECKRRMIYVVFSRNLVAGVFNPDDDGFVGIRRKFASEYLFTEYHWDTGAPFGTVRPVKELEFLDDDIMLWERYPQSTCIRCGEQVTSDRVSTEGQPLLVKRRHVYTELGAPVECDANPRATTGSTYTPLMKELHGWEDEARRIQEEIAARTT